ncbi:hypothetical protein HZC08_01975 [Candidatus Micrarchaeota archaeon]|nr:hypothetical protein [Candidatus Micrarchaeota archaeon]
MVESSTILKVVAVFVIGILLFKLYSVASESFFAVPDSSKIEKIGKEKPPEAVEEVPVETPVEETDVGEYTEEDTSKYTGEEVVEEPPPEEESSFDSSDSYYVNENAESVPESQTECDPSCASLGNEYVQDSYVLWKTKAKNLDLYAGPSDFFPEIEGKDSIRMYVNFLDSSGVAFETDEPVSLEVEMYALSPGEAELALIYKAKYVVPSMKRLAFYTPVENRGIWAYYSTMNTNEFQFANEGEEYTKIKVVVSAVKSDTNKLKVEKVINVFRSDLGQ